MLITFDGLYRPVAKIPPGGGFHQGSTGAGPQPCLRIGAGVGWDEGIKLRSPVSSHSPLRPDFMALREALRGLRFLLRRGGESLAETIPIESLPKSAADLAGAVLHVVGGIARNVDELASGLVESVLGEAGQPSVTLDQLAAGQDSADLFGAAVYVALRSVLRRLNAPGVLVSEAAAQRAWDLTGKPDAATLTINLLDARVMRGTTAQEAARVPGSALEPVAIFAVLLWLQSTRSDAENEEALHAAADLAVALAPEVTSACADRDAFRIAALYARYAAHV